MTTTTTPPAVCRSGLSTFLTQQAAADARRDERGQGRIYACTLCRGWHWRRR